MTKIVNHSSQNNGICYKPPLTGPKVAFILSVIIVSFIYFVLNYCIQLWKAKVAGGFSSQDAVNTSTLAYFAFFPDFILILVPWALAVHLPKKTRFSPGPTYFFLSGCFIMGSIGCAFYARTLQTFSTDLQYVNSYIDCLALAAQRQGILFLITGASFGMIYWLLCVHQRMIDVDEHSVQL